MYLFGLCDAGMTDSLIMFGKIKFEERILRDWHCLFVLLHKVQGWGLAPCLINTYFYNKIMTGHMWQQSFLFLMWKAIDFCNLLKPPSLFLPDYVAGWENWKKMYSMHFNVCHFLSFSESSFAWFTVEKSNTYLPHVGLVQPLGSPQSQVSSVLTARAELIHSSRNQSTQRTEQPLFSNFII